MKIKCPKCNKSFEFENMSLKEYLELEGWKVIMKTKNTGIWICSKCKELIK